jgi:hypothetical protein
MPPKRGSRPTGPRPWPASALAARDEAFALAEEIGKLAKQAKVNPAANIYLTQRYLAEIEAFAERQQRVLNDALRGPAPDPALATIGEMIADLIADLAEQRRRTAELERRIAALEDTQ